MRYIFIVMMISAAISCGSSNGTTNNGNATAKRTPAAPLPEYTYEIVKTYPHDPKAFTQGLIFKDGFLYESTGQQRESTLRKVELETGKVLKTHKLADEIFAEGLTVFGGKLFQVSWRNRQAWEYDAADFRLLREISYEGEGWGLTANGTELIMSDGTHILKFLDPDTFKVVRQMPVFQPNGKPLFLLNELEWVKGEIWANIWHSEETETSTTQGRMVNIGRPNIIARIDASTGKVIGWIDLAGISPDDHGDTSDRSNPKSENTLNGIAYDEASDRLFVTGKMWRKLFEIKIKPKA